MKITVKYFGWIAETVGTAEENVLVEKSSLNEFIDSVQSKFPILKNSSYRISYNLSLNHNNPLLQEGDEIAFLPPFSGG